MPEKKVNGLRTAVKYGEMTAKQALDELSKRAKVSGYTSENLVAWLSRK